MAPYVRNHHPNSLYCGTQLDFVAFELCAPKDVKIVILGQDPYHTPGVAHGLAFSTLPENPRKWVPNHLPAAVQAACHTLQPWRRERAA
jgi:uracil DNA glycosylase